MAGQQYRDAYFLFGSACRLLAGKISKDYKVVLEDLWTWSKRKVDEINLDVPDFSPPVDNGKPPLVIVSTGNPGTPPVIPEQPVEPPVIDAAPAVVEPPIVLLTAEQQERFVSHCLKQGFTEEGILTFLKANDIKGTANIPLSKARVLWEQAKELEVIQQYR